MKRDEAIWFFGINALSLGVAVKAFSEGGTAGILVGLLAVGISISMFKNIPNK